MTVDGHPHLLNPDERLDELHWVLSYHVHHLGRMAAELDRLSLPQAARDFRQSVNTWDRLLQEIEDARGLGGASKVARGPAFSRAPLSPAPAPQVLHLPRQRCQDPGHSV
jgi:hypothetical protein